MCGIAGFVDKEIPNQRYRKDILDRMCQAIVHRGPDDQGTLVTGDVALGMRRLSIIDLTGGQQPIFNEDGSVAVVFNGEIYNYRELKQELQTRGHLFRTDSDTETIAHAYEEFGTDCVSRLNGMFAFAVWDANCHQLFIARDRIGEKPLYYSVTRSGAFVFGSELKCLLQHPGVSREVDPQAVDAFLRFGYVPEPLSILLGIKKLPAGNYLTLADGNVKVESYWDLQFEPTLSGKEEDIVEELREILAEAVRSRLISDVPLGAFLSGGIDSTTVVGLMSRYSSQPVKTFSIGFAEDSYNELKYARIAARRLGTDHHEFIVEPEICGIVDDLVNHFDEPFADSSAIPTYMVSKLARQHVTVALSGDGGDELFAGYTRYQTDRRRRGYARLPRILRENILEPLSNVLPHRTLGRNYIHNISLDHIARYLDSVEVFTKLNRPLLYAPEFRQQLIGKQTIGSLISQLSDQWKTADGLNELLYMDSKTYLPGDILTKVDRMSMAVSLEVRAPFLDHRLVDFVTRIPSSMKMRGNEGKHILKRAVQGIVPDEILKRPKMGFGIPIQQWINKQLREYMHDVLTDKRTRERNYVNPAYVEILLNEHERGRRDHSTALWALLVMEIWFRKYVDLAESESPTVAAVGL